MDHDIVHMRLTIWLTIATLCAVILFAAFPFLDLRISSLFFNGQAGDWAGRSPDFMFWRDVLRHGGEIFAVMTFLIFLGNVLIGSKQQTGWRVWAFIWGNTLLCAGLLVNGILKTWLGRARPDGILEFGGIQTFTPAFQLSNQCFKNCSFSSGEAALIASVVLPVCVLPWPQLSRRGRAVCTATAAFLIIATAAMRVAAGRHFLSDTTMSILFAALTTLILYRLLAIGQHRHVFAARPVVADVWAILEYAWTDGRRLLARSRRKGLKMAAILQAWAAKEMMRLSRRRSDVASTNTASIVPGFEKLLSLAKNTEMMTLSSSTMNATLAFRSKPIIRSPSRTSSLSVPRSGNTDRPLKKLPMRSRYWSATTDEPDTSMI